MKIHQKLAEILELNQFSSNLAHLKAYGTDASQLEGVADLIVWPSSVEQVRQIVRLANTRNFNIVPRGAGTSLEGQTIPDNSVVMDLTHLNKIIGINREDHYIIVEAGLTLKKLNEVLKRYGLIFPIIPYTESVATIGGMAANNSYGKYSFQYKCFLDNVIEMEIVDGSGKVLNMKRPEKIVGTEGTLAIITQKKLKITKIPNKSHHVFQFKNAVEMIKHINTLDEDEIISMQYFNKTASKMLGQDEVHQLLVEYNTPTLGEAGNNDKIKKQLMDTLHQTRHYVIKTLQVPEDKLESFLKVTRRNNIPAFGTFAPNIFQLFFTKGQKRLMQELLEQLSKENVYPLLYGKIHKQYFPEQDREDAGKEKKVYDPAHILNKGKRL